MIGDMLHNQYHIVDELGHGGYSIVWLVQDTHEKQYVALTVNIAELAPRGAKTLRALSGFSEHPGRDTIPAFLDEFEDQILAQQFDVLGPLPSD
ncbi:hypothetical protein BDW59DRAFT_150366 [Aspergillus cavernicola]|uniref:Protein kinase domain-containing protein n=1 Tax=Aspergillus cavernicola TaxID=176166 RepID=A0ABR4HZL6_9EURO